MSRNAKPNLGEPYQIYSEVVNAGKNVQGMGNYTMMHLLFLIAHGFCFQDPRENAGG